MSEQLPELLSSYVTQRDNFVSRYNHMRQGTAIFVPGSGAAKWPELSVIVDDHARMLMHLLPTMSLAQWEALNELSGSALNTLRNRK